jgi:hypothetical protein
VVVVVVVVVVATAAVVVTAQLFCLLICYVFIFLAIRPIKNQR